MQETKENSLFAELTPEESASVNGGCHYANNRYNRHRTQRRSWVVYRRNYDGSFRRVVRYAYY
ncbi:hypothetical protein QUB70_05320 [Microcoleus sp. A003_D6]|uniref:hypothetical protein n=1 Tax=Microcoleus sp. A003_D6 TaxID=3055266 RepID=UPI002FD5146A